MPRAALRFLLPALLLAAAGCQTSAPEVAVITPPPAAPRGVEGNWSSVGGPVPYTANFSAGRFATVETATNALLAEGSYTNLGPGQVTITYTSKRTNQQVAANCNQTGPNTLSCATSANSRFELSRA